MSVLTQTMPGKSPPAPHDPLLCGLTGTCPGCRDYNRRHVVVIRAEREQEFQEWSERQRQDEDAAALASAIRLDREQLRRAVLDLLAPDFTEIALAVAQEVQG